MAFIDNRHQPPPLEALPLIRASITCSPAHGGQENLPDLLIKTC